MPGRNGPIFGLFWSQGGRTPGSVNAATFRARRSPRAAEASAPTTPGRRRLPPTTSRGSPKPCSASRSPASTHEPSRPSAGSARTGRRAAASLHRGTASPTWRGSCARGDETSCSSPSRAETSPRSPTGSRSRGECTPNMVHHAHFSPQERDAPSRWSAARRPATTTCATERSRTRSAMAMASRRLGRRRCWRTSCRGSRAWMRRCSRARRGSDFPSVASTVPSSTPSPRCSIRSSSPTPEPSRPRVDAPRKQRTFVPS